MSELKSRARPYNQTHTARRYTPSWRRVSVYVTWSYPAEANRDVTVMDNRFSTMTEVRRIAWPDYEAVPYGDPNTFQQGIAGTLELFFRDWQPFQDLIAELTGHAVPIYQRVDHAGRTLALDDRILADTDALLVFGLDHSITGQEAAPEEIEALRQFLSREGTCLLLGPHHDVGASPDEKERAIEHAHHGDPLVPRQQQFARYVRSLMTALDIPVENQYGLRPARAKGSNQVAPLSIDRDLDKRGWLKGVTTFNFHSHLPHYALTGEDDSAVRVLARQPIDMTRAHPFTNAGNREFNSFLWLPPSGTRAGDILMADSTIFSTLFGIDESLEQLWKNIATAS
jgi:hypothetical protein